jgi:predicted MPP superfamily phosphohydrolase
LQIASRKLSNPGTPLHILQLSDLHVERLTRRERALSAHVAELKPDLIALTGDFLSTSYNQDARALADLRTFLAQLEAPGGIYAIWGTAEVDRPEFLRPLLDELHIVVLDNEAADVSIRGHHIWLMGISCTRDLATDAAVLGKLTASAPNGAFTLLLYHLPDLMPAARDLNVDLFLAGHTHGGQWRVPGFGALLTSSRFWKRYEGGHYYENGTHLYVSRGIGMEGFGAPRARLFCPPEVVWIRLSGAKEGR